MRLHSLVINCKKNSVVDCWQSEEHLALGSLRDTLISPPPPWWKLHRNRHRARAARLTAVSKPISTGRSQTEKPHRQKPWAHWAAPWRTSSRRYSTFFKWTELCSLPCWQSLKAYKVTDVNMLACTRSTSNQMSFLSLLQHTHIPDIPNRSATYLHNPAQKRIMIILKINDNQYVRLFFS